MSQLVKVLVKVKNADGKSEETNFYIKVQTKDNEKDCLKDFLHALKLRTYWMPDAKLLDLYWYERSIHSKIRIMCGKDLQNAIELTGSAGTIIFVHLLNPTSTDNMGPDFNTDSVCDKCNNGGSAVVANKAVDAVTDDLAGSLQLVTLEMDKISQLVNSASVQLRTVNDAVTSASSACV